MGDLFEDFFDDAAALKNVDTDTGRNLSALVRDLRDVERQIEDKEAELKSLNQQKHRLSTESIPMLMAEMGVDRLDVDGLTVVTKLQVHASIPAEKKDEAFSWLRANGLDDIIKNDVVVSFGKGEDNVAGNMVGMLQEQGFDPQTKTYVHSSTLKAFVRERVANGKPIDLDMFGAFVANTAEIRRKA